MVAGIKYTLEMVMSDGSQHRVQILSQAWMTPQFTLIADELL